MGLDAVTRRRWVGGTALAVALAMLAGGETVLKGRLSDVAFLVYWMVCMGLTVVAVVTAFLDVRGLQRRSREEQRDLFKATLEEIVTDAEKRPHQPVKREDRAGRRG